MEGYEFVSEEEEYTEKDKDRNYEILTLMDQQFSYPNSTKGKFSLFNHNYNIYIHNTDHKFYVVIHFIIDKVNDLCEELGIPTVFRSTILSDIDKNDICFPLYIAIVQCVCTQENEPGYYTKNYDYEVDTNLINEWETDHPKWASTYRQCFD